MRVESPGFSCPAGDWTRTDQRSGTQKAAARRHRAAPKPTTRASRPFVASAASSVQKSDLFVPPRSNIAWNSVLAVSGSHGSHTHASVPDPRRGGHPILPTGFHQRYQRFSRDHHEWPTHGPGHVYASPRWRRLLEEHVLLRRPLLSSRCSRWHRVPRPRRVDGATCHAIDAMPHAG